MTNSPLEIKFRRALHEEIDFEGGYVNNAKDPGGATKWGVTQHTYDAWNTTHHIPHKSVKDITKDEVEAIYRAWYWAPVHCDKFTYPIALMLFDCAIQWGAHGTMELLAACPVLATAPGPQADVFARLANCDAGIVVQQIYSARAAFRLRRVKEAPSQIVFLRGWQNRDKKLLALAQQALATSSAK